MAARAKKTNRSKRVDSVRPSRDGHQFHEAWVARCALRLLLPRFDLRAIAVEGLSEEDLDAAIEAARALLAGEELDAANRAALAG